MRPGAKWDACLVLYGVGGLGKDLWLESLAGMQYLSKTPSCADNWNRVYSVRGKCLAIFSEGEGLLDKPVSAQKAYLENAIDTYALKFQSETVFPRRHVCAVTTNRKDILQDTTGNRRYFTMAVSALDLDGLRKDRDQIWAQACSEKEIWGVDETLALPSELWDENLENAAQYRNRSLYENILSPLLVKGNWCYENNVQDSLKLLTGYHDTLNKRVTANMSVSRREVVAEIRDAMTAMGFELKRNSQKWPGPRRYVFVRMGTRIAKDEEIWLPTQEGDIDTYTEWIRGSNE